MIKHETGESSAIILSLLLCVSLVELFGHYCKTFISVVVEITHSAAQFAALSRDPADP